MNTNTIVSHSILLRLLCLGSFAMGASFASGCTTMSGAEPVAGDTGDTEGLTTADTSARTTAEPGAAENAIAPLSGVFRPFRNVGSSLCLQPSNGSTADVAIVQAPCDGSDAQSWLPLRLSGNDYNFQNQHSLSCMYLNGPASNGTQIVQAPCIQVSNQLWRTSLLLPEVVTVTTRVGNRVTNFCIDVPGGSATPGVPIQLFTCNGTLAQRWVIGV
jgi:ricin-type beta-trefoil lectin protein